MAKVLQVTKKDSFETIHDLISCYILSIKLHYGLNDTDSKEYQAFIGNLKARLCEQNQTNIFWRLQDISSVNDVRLQIKFADSAIHDSDQDSDHENDDFRMLKNKGKYNQADAAKVRSISESFGSALAKFQAKHPKP